MKSLDCSNYSYVRFCTWSWFLINGVNGLSEKSKIDAETVKHVHERMKVSSLILKELRSQGPLTLDELIKASGIDKEKLFRHIITMRQFGKTAITSEQDNQLVYGFA